MPFRIRIFLASLGVILLLVVVVPLLVPVRPLDDTVPASRLAGEDSSFTELRGVRIHYRSGGDGEPAFLLLHGYPANSAQWGAVAPELALYGQTIAFDRPGFGLSGRPEPAAGPGGANPYSAEEGVAQTVALLDELGIEEAILVGSSSGAITAVETALARPDRVRALVLVGAPLWASRAPPLWLRPLMHTPQLERVGPLLMRQLGGEPGLGLYSSQWADPERIGSAQLASYALTFSVDEWDRGLWEVSRASRPSEAPERLSALELPVLVVAGAADQIVPPEDSERLARELPHATLALMEGCGHVPHEECPSQFVDLLLGWLESLAESG